MRYWAWFAAKLIVAGAVFYGLLALLGPLAPDDLTATLDAPKAVAVAVVNPNSQSTQAQPPLTPAERAHKEAAEEKARAAREAAPLEHAGAYLAINLALMVWFILAAGAFYLIVRDQRYRCRVCLRRLRMPVETGSRGFMLQLGRPRVEYICPYGHGTLKQEEYETSELENPQWTGSSGDMWEELYAASKNEREK
jgi:hypothetical protein